MDDVPHLTKEAQEAILAGMPVHQREARRTGVPSLGSGAIFPILESEIAIDDFPIPEHWPRGFGMDTGWNFTAGVWGTRNREADIVYVYDVYKQSEEKPSVHADAFKSRGSWIPGAGDCADINRMDGEQFLATYRRLGLDLVLPDKRSKEANILEVWLRLTTGRLKIFKSCMAWWDEFRLYRRDENGKIVKANDHVMDATQYLIKTALNRMKVKPALKNAAQAWRPVSALS